MSISVVIPGGLLAATIVVGTANLAPTPERITQPAVHAASYSPSDSEEIGS